MNRKSVENVGGPLFCLFIRDSCRSCNFVAQLKITGCYNGVIFLFVSTTVVSKHPVIYEICRLLSYMNHDCFGSIQPLFHKYLMSKNQLTPWQFGCNINVKLEQQLILMISDLMLD